METITKQLTEINVENLAKAKSSIESMAQRRKLVVTGKISTELPTNFPSQKKKKEFQRILWRVITHPTMKNSNIYLHKLSKYNEEPKAEVEYSEKEKAIQKARKEWKESLQIMLQKKALYLTEKGDFYKR